MNAETQLGDILFAERAPQPVVKHYHVISGMGGGYLPNDNATFADLESAREYAADRVIQWREGEYDSDDPRVCDSIGPDYYEFIRPDSPYDLGEYIEVTECTEDCDPEDNGY